MNREKGLLIFTLRNAFGDCSNGGVSSKHEEFILIGDMVDPVFDVTEDHPALELRRKVIGNREHYYLRPAAIPETVWTMFGGNFAYTSDSRFPNNYPLPIHDRIEGAN